jgi:uncharacterized membrane protein YebE (DUF533 family)
LRILNRLKEVIGNLLQSENGTNERDYDREVYILLKAMVNSAKSDGHIDDIEQKRIMEFMGDMTAMQKLFVEKELKAPLNLKSFIKEVPKGMEQQVYYMSLFAIDLDVASEMVYLDTLAKGLRLSNDEINSIHESLGAVASA